MKSSSICLLHIPGTGFQPSEVRTVTAEEKLSRGRRLPALPICYLTYNHSSSLVGAAYPKPSPTLPLITELPKSF